MSFENYELLKGKTHVFKSVTYEKVMKMLEKFKTGIIFIGGSWCKNCQAVVDILNKTAKKNKIRSIYHFDPKFINIFKEEVDLRDCGDLETKLNYYYLVEKLGYKNDTLVQDTFIPRISVPAIIGIKNGVCVGVVEEEYLLDDDILHKENSTEDEKEQYIERLTNLFQKVKA